MGMGNIHGVEKVYACNHCKMEFMHKKSLDAHNKAIHSKQTFVCLYSFCNKSFTDKSHFNDHMRRHAGDKRHKCEYCSKAFVTFTELKVHTRTHTGEKPYQCEYCKKRFTQSSNLTV